MTRRHYNFQNRNTTYTIGLAKAGLMYFVDTFLQVPAFDIRINFSAENFALRQAVEYYAQI